MLGKNPLKGRFRIGIAAAVAGCAFGLLTLAVASKDKPPAEGSLQEVTAAAGALQEVKASNGPAETAAEVAGPSAQPPEITDAVSKAVLRVENLSCSSCIENIRGSLSGMEGILAVLVDLSGGIAEVYFDTDRLEDTAAVASTITEAGYPATVIDVLDADGIRSEERIAAEKAKVAVASVGGYDISRNAFETDLAHARNRYESLYGTEVFASPSGKALLDQLKAQILSRLVNEGIQLQEIRRAGFTVSETEVEKAFVAYLKERDLTPETFADALKSSGWDREAFMEKMRRRVLVDRYLVEEVFDGVTSLPDRQNHYAAWFANAKSLAPVIYFDKDIRRIMRSQAAAGGCSGGSSCSVAGPSS